MNKKEFYKLSTESILENLESKKEISNIYHSTITKMKNTNSNRMQYELASNNIKNLKPNNNEKFISVCSNFA
jgi:hypothetical protein